MVYTDVIIDIKNRRLKKFQVPYFRFLVPGFWFLHKVTIKPETITRNRSKLPCHHKIIHFIPVPNVKILHPVDLEMVFKIKINGFEILAVYRECQCFRFYQINNRIKHFRANARIGLLLIDVKFMQEKIGIILSAEGYEPDEFFFLLN